MTTSFPFPDAYRDLQPALVWRHFGALNALPRPSGDEAAARSYVQALAEERHALWKTDARGNIVVRVSPRNQVGGGRDASEGAPIVVLQSHLDMVCQKRPDVNHNFATDPIRPRRVTDQIFASGTTLGADNGLGAALMLAVLTDDSLTHGPLELLFTVEEETGLYGAAHLDGELVHGRMMINLDSEEPDEVTIGCAGGAGAHLYVPVVRADVKNALRLQIVVGGLQGGHSGMQIHEPLANAIKVLTEVVRGLLESAPGTRIVALDGGTAHNAIPRDATATLSVPVEQTSAFDAAFATISRDLETRWRADEPGFHLRRAPDQTKALPMTEEATARLLELLHELPHGVATMSEQFEGKVQTSSNLAEAHSGENEVEIHVSNRSFRADDLKATQTRVAELGEAAQARVQVRDGYPGWEPRAESPLLDATIEAWRDATGKTPRVEVVHAGLECGILSERLPGLDAVSFGPLIRGAHTPEEWVSISSVRETWTILMALLAKLA